MRIACVDTGLTLFATEADAEGYLFGPEFSFNYERVASQVRMLRELDAPMVFGVYEPGRLRHKGMKPSLESPYFYLHMIDEAGIKHPWYISIWGQGALDDTAILRRAIELGGHIRTGLELFYYPARNPTNLELLQQARRSPAKWAG